MYDYYGQYGQYYQHSNAPAAAGSASTSYQNPVLQTPLVQPVLQPAGSNTGSVISQPDATSSPRRPVYENISDDNAGDNGSTVTRASAVVMSDNTVNASAFMSASQDLGNLSITNPNINPASSSTNPHGTVVTVKQGASNAENSPVIQAPVSHGAVVDNVHILNNPVQNMDNPVQNMDNPANLGANAENNDQQVHVSPQSFPQNIFHLPQISQSRRITTAYKYVPFVRRVVTDPRPTSEARGSDDEEVPAKPEEISENSFPIASYIQKSWRYQNASFKETLKKAIVATNETTPAEVPASENQNEDQEATASGSSQSDPASKPKKQEDSFSLYAATFGSILKGKPTKKQSDFHYNEPLYASFVELDGDINKLRRDDRKKWELGLRLSADEIKNIQIAMSHSLNANSHLSAYLKASRAALNNVLVTLDPEQHAENIATLHDVKYMLYGAVMAMEQNVRNDIYVHAGLTAQIRADFLKAQGNYIPIHIKQALLHENFGGSGLFNSQIHKYTAEIAAHNEKIHQNKVHAAINQRMAPPPPPPPPNPSQSGNLDGYKIPKFNKFQNQAGQGQGQQDGGAGRGRGRGQNKGQRPPGQQNQNNNNRGGGRGQGRGGRGRGKKN